jgi:hypothetical protein
MINIYEPYLNKENLKYTHDALKYEEETRNFSYIRKFDGNDNRHPEYWKIIKNIIG